MFTIPLHLAWDHLIELDQFDGNDVCHYARASMEAPLDHDYLEEVVADGQVRIARQIELVNFLERHGYRREAEMARELLATITETVQAIALSLRK